MAGADKEREDEGNERILENFEGYQEYFDEITEAVKNKLSEGKEEKNEKTKSN